jgi:hypothetical protein
VVVSTQEVLTATGVNELTNTVGDPDDDAAGGMSNFGTDDC